MHVLDLFSGIGGFSLGLERAGFTTAAFCEIEPYCQRVLSRHWPDVPIHSDIRQLDGTQYAGTVDVVCGGYPCQPFSVAGKQQGEADPRHLWPEMYRIIREVCPRWVIAENVRGHISLGFDTVAAQLEDEGFTVWPFIVPACAVGAPHRRDRLWIVAHSERTQRRQGESPRHVPDRANAERQETSSGVGAPSPDGDQGIVADTGHPGLHERWQPSRLIKDVCRRSGVSRDGISGGCEEEGSIVDNTLCGRHGASEEPLCPGWDGALYSGWWATEPEVGRVAHGVPSRMDRLKGLGNAVVPQIPELIGRAIMQYEVGSTKGRADNA